MRIQNSVRVLMNSEILNSLEQVWLKNEYCTNPKVEVHSITVHIVLSLTFSRHSNVLGGGHDKSSLLRLKWDNIMR